MQKLFVIAICPLIVLAGPARAADITPQASAPAPALEGLWAGAYAGLNAGWIWSGGDRINNTGTDTDSHGLGSALASGSIPGSLPLAHSGFIGGGQIGYNWHWAVHFVSGVEADFDGTNANGHANSVFPGTPSAVPLSTSFTTVIDTVGTARFRAGWLFSPILLFYGTGGLAYGQTKLGSAFVCPTCIPPPASEASTALQASRTVAGWTAGAGVEWKLAAKWSAKLEYLYIDLGPQYNTIQYSYPSATSSMTSTFHGRDNIVRLGVNYRLF